MVEPIIKDSSSTFDLQKTYDFYRHLLKGAKDGEVVTRFPPEPSGYLHIGHVKAAMLNYHFAKMWKGKLIIRFDDTNPNKEKTEYVQSILEDLATLGIVADVVTYTSDYFGKLEELMKKAIEQGKAYCDDTPVEVMRKERGDGIESKHRNMTPEENLKIWDLMRAGRAKEWCVRGKISMSAKNKCMRDPVLFRSSDVSHHRVGKKYNVYPTYDWACPIVDSIEGVTHTLRTNEFADRNEMYNWFNLIHTTLSKRKLTWFVDTKRVEGWDDPRFPTLRGIMRRGITVETLTDFMLEQGPTKNTNLQHWDKLWAKNKKYIDPQAGRYTAISREKICTLKITNLGSEMETLTIPLHPQNPALRSRPLFRANVVYLEYDDAQEFVINEKITLMRWANCIIKDIRPDGDGLYLEGEIIENDTDFKTTKKVNWLPKCDLLVNVHLHEYDHLINVKKVEDDMDFESVLNEKTEFITQAFGDPNLKTLAKGAVVQLERRGYFIVDRVDKITDFDRELHLIFIPDGKSKPMSKITTKVCGINEDILTKSISFEKVDVSILASGVQQENAQDAAKQSDQKSEKEVQTSK